MASRTKNLNMFADCRRAFELATRDGRAQKLCATKGAAVHFRQRMYQFRQLEAKNLFEVYRMRPETFEKAGTTPFDQIICRIEPVDLTVNGQHFEWAVNMYKVEETPLLNYRGEVEEAFQEPAKDEGELLG
jgi:hypothetical protein